MTDSLSDEDNESLDVESMSQDEFITESVFEDGDLEVGSLSDDDDDLDVGNFYEGDGYIDESLDEDDELTDDESLSEDDLIDGNLTEYDETTDGSVTEDDLISESVTDEDDSLYIDSSFTDEEDLEFTNDISDYVESDEDDESVYYGDSYATGDTTDDGNDEWSDSIDSDESMPISSADEYPSAIESESRSTSDDDFDYRNFLLIDLRGSNIAVDDTYNGTEVGRARIRRNRRR